VKFYKIRPVASAGYALHYPESLLDRPLKFWIYVTIWSVDVGIFDRVVKILKSIMRVAEWQTCLPAAGAKMYYVMQLQLKPYLWQQPTRKEE
jgi:hypothetical protein